MYDVAQILNFIYLSLFHIFSTVSVKNIPRTYTLKELNILTFGALWALKIYFQKFGCIKTKHTGKERAAKQRREKITSDHK